jgi:hypothetical protein
MKEYSVKYKLKGYGYITVIANNEDDAMEEIDRVFCGDKPRHEKNDWIDDDVLWDIEWTTSETIDAVEI